MSSISANANALTALRQQAQAYLAQRPSQAQAITPNPYGTITQSYQSEGILTASSKHDYDLTKIDATTTANSGEGQALLAVAQAFKEATPVDIGTGMSEISAGALAGVTKSLESAFSGLLNESKATYQTNTGGLSDADIDAAVTQAVQQFTSGQGHGAFSLSLSTVKNSVVDLSQSTPGMPGISASYATQAVSLTSRQMTFSISLSADGKLSSSYQGTSLNVDQGTVAENGVKGADAMLSPTGWFGTTYTTDSPIMGEPQEDAGPAGVSRFDAETLAFVQAAHTTILPASDQGWTGLETIDEARQGGVIAARGQDQNSAFSTQASVLKTVTAAAQAFRDAAKDTVTAKLTVTSTMTVSLINSKGESSFLYKRPDGTFGQFRSGGLNAVA